MLYEWYVRFMIWLGAAPPPDYEGYLPEDDKRQHFLSSPQETDFDSLLAKAKRNRLIMALLILPIFLFLAGMVLVESGKWQVSIVIIGAWAAMSLFFISFWFQALVVFVISVFAFSQGNWLVGCITLLLTVYLAFAATVSDKQVSEAFKTVRTHSPQAANRLDKFIQFKQNPRLALIFMLFVVAFILGGYVLGKLIDVAIWMIDYFITL